MSTTLAELQRTASPTLRLRVVGAALALAAVAFLTLGVSGNVAFVMELRLPKVLGMVLVGWATGVATVPFQTVTHNRLLTPSIMGLDALYVFLQTLLVLVLGVGVAATLGAVGMFGINVGLLMLGTVGLITVLFGRKRRSVHVLVLAGLVLGAVLRSASTLLQRILDPTTYLVLQGNLFASFTLISPQLLWVSVGVIAIVSVWLLRQSATLDVMLLGHDAAVSLGVDYSSFVRKVILASTLLIAVSTALVGPITFLGLIVAALAHLVVGTSKHRHVMPMAGMLGALLLVGGQAILEHGLGMATVLSVIIEFVGGIVFIWLVVRSSK
ncbi:iron chelate uptake ABC transporter family permease subunit [Tessaracoccus oleiagri]|uniref:Iron complex transport system permease protein n=1 Tax=Tessaracoccus oleiagri TaxID=686624 RepID=A0A1G9JS46_9ACTN|nr:iron chelate uptake ABC transporter family permease subunit [Tessaracoccus oleiagri]SDL40359.1 iron complex transport system permease protein [Tessaracoccus oleiagri]